MQPMNKPLEIREVQTTYVAKHEPLPDETEGGRYFPPPPLKFAVRMGVAQQYLEALQDATDSSSPFDFAAFVTQCSGASVAS